MTDKRSAGPPGGCAGLGSGHVLASLHLSLAAMVDSLEEISESFVIMLLPMGWAKTTRSLKLSRVVPSRRRRATSSDFFSRLALASIISSCKGSSGIKFGLPLKRKFSDEDGQGDDHAAQKPEQP